MHTEVWYGHTQAHPLRLETHCCASPSINNSLFLPLSFLHIHIFTGSALHYDAVINWAINRLLYSERHRDPRHMTWPSNSRANTGNIGRIIRRICKKTTVENPYRHFANFAVKCILLNRQKNQEAAERILDKQRDDLRELLPSFLPTD